MIDTAWLKPYNQWQENDDLASEVERVASSSKQVIELDDDVREENEALLELLAVRICMCYQLFLVLIE